MLESGLKYATNIGFKKFDAFIDTKKIVRKLNIKKHFADKPTIGNIDTRVFQDSGLRNRSTLNPKKSSDHFLEAFKAMVKQDIRLIQTKVGRRKGNIQKGIEALEKRKNIAIRMADKGGGIVVLKSKEFIKELNRLVGDVNTYKKLSGNPTNKLKASLKRIIKQAQHKGNFN